jgi:hypothetical protein
VHTIIPNQLFPLGRYCHLTWTSAITMRSLELK